MMLTMEKQRYLFFERTLIKTMGWFDCMRGLLNIEYNTKKRIQKISTKQTINT